MTAVVIPTIGRPSLRALLMSLAAAGDPLPAEIIIVDDRADARDALKLGSPGAAIESRTRVVRGRAAGPAAARNTGWQATTADWIAFLDDDVVVESGWCAALAADLTACAADVAGSQARLRVPLPAHRRPTDWERNVAALAGARWITADCAYRREDLLAVGGFDERFPRAFREDADLALRLVARGRRIVDGGRRSIHPVRAARPDVSLRLQAGNADDVLMEALHGRDWYARAGAPRGAFGEHVATVACAAAAALGAAAWATLTARFAWRRIAPGPRTPAEIATMIATSIAIPFAAVAHRIGGRLALRGQVEAPLRGTLPRPRAVLFDRDGTLVHDVPDNRDPAAVVPVDGARDGLARLRAAGLATAIVSNQSAVARGAVTLRDVAAINARIDALLGPFDTIVVCPHAEDAGCACRKPAPGMIVAAARALGVAPRDCVVVGDIGSDVEAAHAAGARAILVPTPVTRREEIQAAPEVAADLSAAVARILATC